ncbi:hypothetical protein SpiBuddy_2045 [Sphaerochaeta globosa str. Buddy]|uniref:Uncharacterized protein n=2 Tax=Sphaerochaeta TaxID=399320 RepID=F0RU07_SPHGB|nr:hypothetical protein SpiBuddy_2045 [Sphaerochaeta globosa str. Buddy]
MKSIITYLESEETRKSIMHAIQQNLYLYQGINTEEKIQSLTGSLYNYLVMECVQVNQYVSLSKDTIDSLNILYRELVLHLRGLALENRTLQDDLEIIVQRHRAKLISALKHNSYNKNQDQLFIPCAEYSGSFQFHLLHLGDCLLKQPILDVGCGKKHQLLSYLEEKGFEELYGLDQYHSDEHRIFCGNWFDYHFLQSTWGSVIAHMSFSNHYRRSLINQDSDTVLYTMKYLEILDSLIVGGLFIYSPAVRTIEETLDRQRYSITYFPNLDDRNLDSVCIQRLC